MRFGLVFGITVVLLSGLSCSTKERCDSHDQTFCEQGITYWVNACGEVEEIFEECDCGCTGDRSGCETCTCTPQCSGRCCGDDGCGGTCQDECHLTGQACDLGNCQCQGSCDPLTCAQIGKECGSWDDGCGNLLPCGACPAGEVCDAGVCETADCQTGWMRCEGICVDVASDARHCGGCAQPCGDDQVCDDGACEGLPQECPPEGCPMGSYCDLNLNICVAGCLEDSGCTFGYICENRICIPGCREDAGCLTGQICFQDSCVEGCRQDPDCSPGEICLALQCQIGCRQDYECLTGQICDELLCRTGCREHGDCPAGQVCRNTYCENGCRENEDCPAGQICVNTLCTTGCDGDDRCPAGQICDSGACRDGCRPDLVACSANLICCGDTLTCEQCCSDQDCPEDQICESDGWDESRICRAGCRQHEDCIFVLEPTFDDPFEAQGVCSAVTLTCYPPCWEDTSVQGWPVRCDGDCVTPGRYSRTICVPSWPDPGFPNCDEPVPDDDGACRERPSCSLGGTCGKACKGYACEYALYPAPHWYQVCWPPDLIEGSGSLEPCRYCSDEPYYACATGRCLERPDEEGYYQCMDWCRTIENCY